MYLLIVSLFIHINLFSSFVHANGNECQFLTRCKCSNFPLFTLIDTSYLSKPQSLLNQDLFCAYTNIDNNKENQTLATTFEQLKYFYYRFRTLTFANYPIIPTKAFRFVHFESQSVKPTQKANNRNVIAFVNIEQTEAGLFDKRKFLFKIFVCFFKGIFEELSLSNSEDQLIISFLNSPSLQYTFGALSKVNCYEIKFLNTNPKISIDFFHQAIFIDHLIIDNPSFSGFLSKSTTSFDFQLNKLSIKDISVRHLQGKHFPMIFKSVRELALENFHVNNGFRSWNNRELAQRFPQVRSLKIFSRSIQKLVSRMFEHFTRLEQLNVNGITTIENEAFFNLYYLKELNLGKDIRQLDSYAFIHMKTDLLLFNQSSQFQLNDAKHFCTFAQFSPSIDSQTFVQFSKNLSDCPCILRYLYRHLEKSFLSYTPTCYSNSSLYILTQEERICYFEQRLLQCDILPDQGITIYGKHYNVSYFYQQQISKQKSRLSIFVRYRIHYILFILVIVITFGFVLRRRKQTENSTYRHLNRLLHRQRISRNETLDVIYHQTNPIPPPPPPTTARATKV